MQLCQNFQSLLALQGQYSRNLNQTEDLATRNLPQNPINFQTNPVPVYPLSGGYNSEVPCNGIFKGFPSPLEIENNSTGGHNDSDNGAAMVENPVPGNGVNFFEDCEHDLSSCLEALNELGPLCF